MTTRFSRMKSMPVMLMLLLLVAAAASAADKWTDVRSRNFNVVGNASEAQLRSVASDLEQFRQSFVEAFANTSNGSGIPVTVVVFKTEDSYQPFKPLVDGKPANVTGYFQTSEDTSYISLVAGTPIPRTVYHQYVHELLRDMPAPVPLWLNEGIAEFFSTFEISAKDKRYSVGQSISDHMDVLRRTPLISFDELFAFDRNSPQYNERDRKGIYYAESWALVNYLLGSSSNQRGPQVAEYLNLMGEGKSPAESFQAAFKTDYKTMQHDLELFIRAHSDWPAKSGALLDKNVIDKDLKARTVTEAETEFYCGDLLLHMSRLIEAETHLKQAATLDPAFAAPWASMGMGLFRRDEEEDALVDLKKAIALDPKNTIAQYYYAYVLDKSSSSVVDDLDAKRGALAKAIDLAPRFIPAYELLAYLNLTADIDYNGTQDLIQKARVVAPGNQNLRFLLAQVLVKKKEFDAADAMLKTLLKNSSLELPIREGAQTLINYIARSRETASQPMSLVEEERRVTPPVVRDAVKEPAPDTPTPAPATSKSGELVLVNPPKARPDGTKITGLLTLMDCSSGLTITLKSANQTLKFHSDTPDRIEFFSNTPTVSTSIKCGPAPGAGIPVIVTYRPTPGGPSAGEPLYIEFVEQ